GRAADRLPVHPAGEAEQGFRGREVAEDVVPLVVQGGAANLDEAGVVGPAVQAQLTQPRRIEGRRRAGRGRAVPVAFVEPPHGRVFGEVHDDPHFVGYVIIT